MKALVFNNNKLSLTKVEKPTPNKNEALIKVLMAGFCNTDIEITKGFMGFNGTLGHEFVGVVEEINAENKKLLGKRVVGEINCGCGECPACYQNLQRHCPNRSTLGIFNKDGCFADYLTLPLENLVEVPENIKNEEAVLIEPLAAAMEILEQIQIKPDSKVIILGDGKLGLLIAFVLSTTNADVLLVGKHENKLAIAEEQGIKTCLLNDNLAKKYYDVVVDATGSTSGLETAIKLVKPRGTIVLKSTIAMSKEFNFAPIVIDEINIVGSRCGQFLPAVRFLEKKLFDISPLIEEVYDFDNAIDAFDKSKTKGSMKVLVKINEK